MMPSTPRIPPGVWLGLWLLLIGFSTELVRLALAALGLE
jgi:hypothetical protein